MKNVYQVTIDTYYVGNSEKAGTANVLLQASNDEEVKKVAKEMFGEEPVAVKKTTRSAWIAGKR